MNIWIPIYSSLAGLLSVFIPLFFIFYTKKGFQILHRNCSNFFSTINFEKIVEDKLDNDLFDAEVELLLDQKLDDLVLVFKREIPMAGTFLVGGLVRKLKESAKGEILKMVPEMKTQLLQRMKKDLDSNTMATVITKNVAATQLLKYCLILSFFGASVGLFWGALLLVIL